MARGPDHQGQEERVQPWSGRGPCRSEVGSTSRALAPLAPNLQLAPTNGGTGNRASTLVFSVFCKTSPFPRKNCPGLSLPVRSGWG